MTIPNVSRNLLVNRDVAPFDNAQLRRAMTLSLDRQAFVDIIADGQGTIGGVMQPPPEGVWGMPAYSAEIIAGLRPGCHLEPCPSPQDHGATGLRTR